MTHHGFGSAPTRAACEDGRTLLSSSQRQRTDVLLAHQQGYGWRGNLPVLLLERCWLRLETVRVQDLGQVLPPDASGSAPELVRFRDLHRSGLEPILAEQLCWQEFGREAFQQALRRYWSAQEAGNHGWTLDRYLALLAEYRLLMGADGAKPIPLVVLARAGAPEPHRIEWCWPSPTPMRHTDP
jgi:hypothetical protein